MTAQIERVARAIAKASGADPDEISFVHIMDPRPTWRTFERHAEAAIEAMKEPEEKPITIAEFEDNSFDAWRAMIDAALAALKE